MLDKEAAALGREILAIVEPEDLEDFDAVVRYQTGRKSDSRSGVGLSLGIGLEAGALLGLLWPVLREMLVDVAKRLAKLGVDEAERELRAWLERRQSRAALNQAQAAEIVAAAIELCRTRGLDAETCAALESILKSRIPVRG